MADLSSYINIAANTVTTANLSATGNVVSNSEVSTAGNVTGNYIIGDGSQLTGITVSGNAPVSTTGNVSAGNLTTTGTVSANNIGNIAALNLNGNASTVLYGNGVFAAVAGGSTYGNSNVNTLLAAWGSNTVSTTGNITAGYLFGNGSQLTGLPATYGNANVTTLLGAFGSNTVSTTGTVYAGNTSTSGNATIGTALVIVGATNTLQTTNGSAVQFANRVNFNQTGTSIVASGNISGANILGSVLSASGNVTGSYILGNGSQLTGIVSSYGNSNVTTLLAAFGSNTMSTTGTITSGNITSGNILTGGLISATGNITGGNVLTGGIVSATGNITTANYFVGNLVGTTVSTTGNVSAGNLILGGQTVQLTGAVNPGYMNVGLTNTIGGIGAGSVLIYDAVLKNNGTAVTYNTSTGVFTLTAGVTYNLMATGSWQQFSDTTSGYIVYAWVDATTGTRLDTTGDSDGIAEPLNRPVNEFNATAAELIYTPVTNQTVKVSVVANGGTASLRGGIGSKAIVTQLNPTVSLGAVTTISATGNVTGGNVLTGGIVSSTGTITSSGDTNGTAFAVVGNGAQSNVALGFFPTGNTPAEMAIRDYSTANSVMYFDTTIGSANTGGSFQFRSSNAYTTLATINTYGVVQPTKPGFRVYGNGVTSVTTTTNTTGVLNGNNWAVDYNQGSYLNSTTGTFTAPVAGLYQVNLNARVANNTAPAAQAIVVKNRATTNTAQVMWETAANPTINHFGVGTISKLAAGDTLNLVVAVGTLTFDQNDSWSVAFLG